MGDMTMTGDLRGMRVLTLESRRKVEFRMFALTIGIEVRGWWGSGLPRRDG